MNAVDSEVRVLTDLEAHRRELILRAAAYSAARRLRRYRPILAIHRWWTR